jgi:hypothetical protein
MAQLTSEQAALVKQYEEFGLDDLYNLLGNLAIEYGDKETQQTFVLGIPNVHESGKRILLHVRSVCCKSREKIEAVILSNKEAIEPIRWAGEIADIIVALKVTGGIPPLTLAVALGKLCNRTLSKLCG